MWSKQWKTEAWQKKPPYHREAKAWMNGLTLTVPYALCNEHPVECWTDHTPLTWIKHTNGKGPVSQFIVDMLSVIDYDMHYIKGPDNKTADGLSRFPLLGPGRLQRKGLTESVDILLSSLVNTDVDTSKLWFYTGKDTQYQVDNVYEWRHALTKPQLVQHRPHCFMDHLSESNIKRINYSMGIWAPSADKVTQQCMAAFHKGRPFACLVPSVLVNQIAVDKDGILDTKVNQLVEKATKITFLSPGLTWVIHGIDFSASTQIKTVYANRATPEYNLEDLVKKLKSSHMTPAIAAFDTRDKWIKCQKQNLAME